MSNFQEVHTARNIDLEANERRLSQALGKDAAPAASNWNTAGQMHSAGEVVHKDGKAAFTDRSKPLGDGAVHAPARAQPGNVIIPGMGEWNIEAAIRMGVLPEGWTPEKGFDQPAEGKAGNPAGQTNATRGGIDLKITTPGQAENAPEVGKDGQDGEGDASVTPAMRAAVEKAGHILDHVDQTHGNEVTNRYLQEIAQTGVLPTDGLPEGITADTLQSVQDGFVAQCNAVLGEVGASVPMLSEMLDDDQLRAARHATLRQDGMVLKELGKIAQTRLSLLPEKNPEAFAALIADMDPKERAVLHKNHDNGRWSVRIPGKPEMSFAQAVRQRVVRF